jgi:hypothetical protein
MQTGLTSTQFDALMHAYCDWAEGEERLILREGVPPSPLQTADARRIGVKHPDMVRLIETPAMPSPEHPLFLAVVGRSRLIPPETEALTLGYGIYIHTARRGERSIVAHELKHVAQQEELGGLRPFYRKYLAECFTHGYPNGPMEREAMGVEEAFAGENPV